MAQGEELFLKYGSHTNQFLFVEYGFVQPADPGSSETTTYGIIDVSPDVERLFDTRGSVGELMRRVLEEEGYWG